jgi:hypothetical protein
MRHAIIKSSVPDDSLRALGRIVVEFNLLEFALSTGIRVTCSASSEISDILVSELSVRAKTDIFFSILRHLHAEGTTIAAFEALRVRILQAEQDRNQLLHSMWSATDEYAVTRIKPTAKAKRGFSLVREGLSAVQINSKADEFHRLAEDVTTFLVQPGTKWRKSTKTNEA